MGWRGWWSLRGRLGAGGNSGVEYDMCFVIGMADLDGWDDDR